MLQCMPSHSCHKAFNVRVVGWLIRHRGVKLNYQSQGVGGKFQPASLQLKRYQVCRSTVIDLEKDSPNHTTLLVIRCNNPNITPMGAPKIALPNHQIKLTVRIRTPKNILKMR